MGVQYPRGTASTHTTAPGRLHLRDNIIAQSSTRAIRTANWLVVHTWCCPWISRVLQVAQCSLRTQGCTAYAQRGAGPAEGLKRAYTQGV
ncbi:hypothetical protein V6N13_061303 [Hibiscus sabdariffa]